MIVNNLIVPLLLYPASIIYTPLNVVKELKNLITNFIWNGGSPKVAYNNLIQSINMGGLKLVDIESKIKALKLTWITRLVNNQDKNWTAIPRLLYNTNDLTKFFMENRMPIKCYSYFYESIHTEWIKIRNNNEKTINNIKREIIWNNQYIKVNSKYLNWKTWRDAGIEYIADILDNKDNDFLTLAKIKDKFGINL